MSVGVNDNQQWQFDKQCLDPSLRQEGISAFMRLRDEEAFVEQAVLTHLPFFDEIVAVHNRCTDRTPEILEKLQGLHPEKIKVYCYDPYVYPQGSKEHAVLPPDSLQSLVNYSNYALSKTTRKCAVKLDGDHIAIPETLSRIVTSIREQGIESFMGFNGINLIKDRDGSIAVLRERPLCGGGDIGFFPVSQETYFQHDPRYETFHCPLPYTHAGILFHHCKFLKKSMGFENYDLSENPHSRYHGQQSWLQNNLATVDFSEFMRQHGFSSDEMPLILR